MPAAWSGEDARIGSIKAGKTADLLPVEGYPSIRIGDLRHNRIVLLAGKLIDADALPAGRRLSGGLDSAFVKRLAAANGREMRWPTRPRKHPGISG